MKRYIVILLILMLLLSGCNKQTDTPITTENEQITSSATEETTDSPISGNGTSLQLPMISVSMPATKETKLANDGEEIFSYVYPNMSLVLPEPEIADKIIVDFLNRVDEASDDAELIKNTAKSEYRPGNWTPYLCQISYKPMRIDSSVLSLLGNYTFYRGTSHPESTDVSVSYDLVTGDVIALKDIFQSDPTETLVNEIVQTLSEQKEALFLFDGFEEIVNDRFHQDLSHEYSWYFSNTGLCFYFSAYDIAPYASGVIVAEIPYLKLAGLMDDAYFPAETETVNGIISAELFDEDQLSNYDSFTEVIVDKRAIKALLHTDTAVYDLRIETGTWSIDGDVFIPEHTIYACYALTAGNAIMIESEIPDTMPRLRITCQSNGQTVCRYLTDSGKDGSILLIQ